MRKTKPKTSRVKTLFRLKPEPTPAITGRKIKLVFPKPERTKPKTFQVITKQETIPEQERTVLVRTKKITMPKIYEAPKPEKTMKTRIVCSQDEIDGYKYRLQQARELLQKCGFVEKPDGTWVRPVKLNKTRVS